MTTRNLSPLRALASDYADQRIERAEYVLHRAKLLDELCFSSAHQQHTMRVETLDCDATLPPTQPIAALKTTTRALQPTKTQAPKSNTASQNTSTPPRASDSPKPAGKPKHAFTYKSILPITLLFLAAISIGAVVILLIAYGDFL